MKKLGCAFLVLISTLCLGAEPASVVRVGALSGENGVFGSLNGLVTMYSDGDIWAQYGNERKWQLIENTGSVSFDIRRATMAHTSDAVPLAAAHELSLCDPLNQIDISSTVSKKISNLLPKTAKIKDVEQIGEKRTLVIYAATDSTVRYEVRVSLFSAGPGYRQTMIGSNTVSSDGNYCGMQVLDGPYRAIFLDEPSGSSDFVATYIYKILGDDSGAGVGHPDAKRKN